MNLYFLIQARALQRVRGRPHKQPQNSELNSLLRGPRRPQKVPKPTGPDLIDVSNDNEDDLPNDVRVGIKDIREKVIALCQVLAQITVNYTTSEILKFPRLAMGPISKRVKIQNTRSAWQVALKECKSDAADEVIQPSQRGWLQGARWRYWFVRAVVQGALCGLQAEGCNVRD
jgi:hypothetical protein